MFLELRHQDLASVQQFLLLVAEVQLADDRQVARARICGYQTRLQLRDVHGAEAKLHVRNLLPQSRQLRVLLRHGNVVVFLLCLEPAYSRVMMVQLHQYLRNSHVGLS